MLQVHPGWHINLRNRVEHLLENGWSYKLRNDTEHRLARLVQLGIRQARYFGRVKTLFQLLMAATVANLTLAATKLGLMGKINQSCASFFAAFHQGLIIAITTTALRLFV